MNTAQISFVKTIAIVIAMTILGYLTSVANLNGVVPPIVATIIVALASALEAQLRANSGNTTALLGSVRVK